jgi:Mpv17 / PMP22 family
LEKIVKIKNPVGGLVARIVLDALIFSPVAVSGYFSVRSILEGSGVDGIQHKLTTRFVPTVVGAWKFWPAANVVNFGMVPVQFRVLYSNVLSLFWTGYLTHVNSKARLTMVSQKR